MEKKEETVTVDEIVKVLTELFEGAEECADDRRFTRKERANHRHRANCLLGAITLVEGQNLVKETTKLCL